MTASNAPELKLFLLGPPRVELAGRSIFVQRRKALALLAYLAVNPTPQRRDNLAALFWPESSQSSARTALSRHCSILKQLLGEQWLLLEAETVGLHRRAELWLDVAHFQQALAQWSDAAADPLVLLTDAVALYRADFLSGFTLSDCPDFDDWQSSQTEILRQAAGGALAPLVQIHLQQGTYAAGITHARRWLSLDPWQELAHQQMMTLHVHEQAPATAIRHYEQYRQTLASEIGVAPGPELTALYEQLCRGEAAGAQGRGQAKAARVELPAFLQDPARATPDQPDAPFVAREQELARLQSTLDEAKAGQGQPRFVIGGAGRGKTTLLSEFARRALAADPDLLVISGHANAYTGIGDPYLPWRAALNRLLGDVEAEVTGGRLVLDEARRLWTAMPLTLPLLADHAPDLVGNFIAGQPLLTRAALVIDTQGDWLPRLEKAAHAAGARLEQTRLVAQFTALLHAIAAQRPLLVILEDLHWADASSINLLFHCCRQLRGHPICLLGSYRHNAIAVSQDDHPHLLVGVMAELKRQYGDIWLDLAAVDVTQGQHFVDAYLDVQAVALVGQAAQGFRQPSSSRGFRQALFAHTRGHPLFTVELVQDLQARRDLQQTGDGSWVVARPIDWARLPAKVEGVIEQRLAGLAADLRQALAVASVEGEIFTAEVIAQVQGDAARTLVQRLSGEADAAGVCINELITLVTEHGFLTPKAVAISLQGQVMLAEGAIAEGIARLEQGLAERRETGAQASRSHMLIWLAEAYEKAGQIERGLAVTAEAETFIAQSDERFWEAELYRAKGDLLLLQGADAGAVETCYHQAIEVARRQAAKSLELRATLRLCRLWQQQGKSADAKQHLAAIVDWFSEGFDTADLIAARALLATLG